MMNWSWNVKLMRIFILTFLLFVFSFTNCKSDSASSNSAPDVFFDDNGALTTKDITQNQNLAGYDQGGHFYCRTRFSGKFGNEKDILEGEKKVRDFVWQHLTEKRLGYIQLFCPGVDTTNTSHYFIEPNEKDKWNVIEIHFHLASSGEITRNEIVFNSFERIENKDIGDWFLVFKSTDGNIIKKLPFY